MQGAARQGFIAMDRNADGTNGWPVVEQDVMTSADAVDPEPKPQQCVYGLLPGYGRESLGAHGQAAMVR
jgi:hypothetical protein